MDEEELKIWYEEKYHKLLGITFEEWLESSPKSEDQAYARMEDIDRELKATEDEYHDSTGDEKWQLEEYREKMRNEYQMLEEMFGLQSHDE